jgi:hypothetical protein
MNPRKEQQQQDSSNEDDDYHHNDFSSRDEEIDDDDESFQELSDDDDDDGHHDDDEMQDDDEDGELHRMQDSSTNIHFNGMNVRESQAPRYGLTQHHLHASRPDMTAATNMGQPAAARVAPVEAPPAPVTEHVPAAATATDSQSMEASMENEPPLDGYERTDRIGQGAYGIVYRGIQRSTGVTVAIKRIPFADAAPEGGVPCNVIREISLLRELDHPNVVRLLDVNQARPGELYLVFEYVAHDLKTFLDKAQPEQSNVDGGGGVIQRRGLPTRVVRSFLRQILEGVGYCHTYRILHRDLKPHNVSIGHVDDCVSVNVRMFEFEKKTLNIN